MMAKKKTTKKKPTGRKKASTPKKAKQARTKVIEMPQVLLRLPPEVVKWADEKASESGMSRSAFLRQLLVSLADAWPESEALADRLFSGFAPMIEEAIHESIRGLPQKDLDRIRRS